MYRNGGGTAPEAQVGHGPSMHDYQVDRDLDVRLLDIGSALDWLRRRNIEIAIA